MIDHPVLIERRDGIVVLTLNRPGKLNAVDLPLQLALRDALKRFAGENPRAVVLTGAGRAFCAGGDRALQRRIAESDAVRVGVVALYREIMTTLDIFPAPLIAAIEGMALGFGAELAALCDTVVMGEGACLADPHVPQGLPPAPVLSSIWPQLAGAKLAAELLRTGRRVQAEEAVRIGLADRLAPAGGALADALRLAETATKRALRPVLSGL